MSLAGSIAVHGNSMGWPEVALREVLSRRKELSRADLPLLGVSLVQGVKARSADDGRPAASLDLSGYKVVHPGDIVMNALGKPHGSIGRSATFGITSPAYWVLRSGPDAESRYLHYLLRSPHMIEEYQRLGKYLPPNQFDISWDDFRHIVIPFPPLDVQRRIADFLDDQVTRIDRALQLRERELELLEAWIDSVRSDLINGCQTEQIPLAACLATRIADGPHETPAFVEEGVPFLSVDNIVDDRICFNGERFISRSEHARFSRKACPRLGDVLVTKAASVGKVALVDSSMEFNVWSPIAILRPNSLVSSQYLASVLREHSVQSRMLTTSNNSTQNNLSMKAMGRIRLPVPSRDDQELVVRQLNVHEAHRRRSGDLLRESTVLLLERKRSLITAAVTGEFDVSTASSRASGVVVDGVGG